MKKKTKRIFFWANVICLTLSILTVGSSYWKGLSVEVLHTYKVEAGRNGGYWYEFVSHQVRLRDGVLEYEKGPAWASFEDSKGKVPNRLRFFTSIAAVHNYNSTDPVRDAKDNYFPKNGFQPKESDTKWGVNFRYYELWAIPNNVGPDYLILRYFSMNLLWSMLSLWIGLTAYLGIRPLLRAEHYRYLVERCICPECRYDLKGLEDDRCPECGHKPRRF